MTATSQKRSGMMRAALKVANEPARRFRLIWNLFGIGLSGLFVVIGAGYAAGGSQVVSGKALQLLINLLPGGLRTYGVIMLALALFLANGLGTTYRNSTRWALILMTFFSLASAILIFLGWGFYPISYGAPWWFLYIAFQCTVLQVLAPSVLSVAGPIVSVVDEEYGVGGDGA